MKYSGSASKFVGKNLTSPVKGLVTIVGGQVIERRGSKAIVKSFDGKETFLIDEKNVFAEENGDDAYESKDFQ